MGTVRNQQARKAFTLIELLVVIAIISLLVSILLPSLNKAKELARAVTCASTLKTFGLAVQYYANDTNGVLPAAVVNDYGEIRDAYEWAPVYAPYMGVPRDDPDWDLKKRLVDNRTQQYGFIPSYTCPSFPPDTGASYGVHYGIRDLFSYYDPTSSYPLKLNDISSVPLDCYIMADGNYYHYSPGSAWPLDRDDSGDVIPDSHHQFSGSYNNADPVRHNGGNGANYMFIDGRVESHSLEDWQDNAGGLWSPISQ